MNKPFSEACERNKQPILDRLLTHFSACSQVLEIGSGTGQHALHFTAAMPHLQWQPTEMPGQLEVVRAWLLDEPRSNLLEPVELDVRWNDWPLGSFNGIYSANTLHIMGCDSVVCLFAGIARHLSPGGVVAIYGPFNYGGDYTSSSNAGFDRMLRARDPDSGIRDSEAVQQLAQSAGLAGIADYAMPANNRLLVWRST